MAVSRAEDTRNPVEESSVPGQDSTIDKGMALDYLQEMFIDQIDPEVVGLILSECEYKVDAALENLLLLCGKPPNTQIAVEQVEHNPEAVTMETDDKIDLEQQEKGPDISPVESVETAAPTLPSVTLPTTSCSELYVDYTQNILSGDHYLPPLSMDPPPSVTRILSSSSAKVPSEEGPEICEVVQPLPHQNPSKYKTLRTELPDNGQMTDISHSTRMKSSTESLHSVTTSTPHSSQTSVATVRQDSGILVSDGLSSLPDHRNYRTLPSPVPKPLPRRENLRPDNEKQGSIHVHGMYNSMPSAVEVRPTFSMFHPSVAIGRTPVNPIRGNVQAVGHGHFVPAPAPRSMQSLRMNTMQMHPNNRMLIIMRGLPGSGKSTLARQLKGQGVILSTDNFFMVNNRYEFDPANLSNAHMWCQNKANQAMKEGKSPVIIDNTNTQMWEMMPYAKMALQHGYRVDIREPTTPWCRNVQTLAQLNTHGVPQHSIVRMLGRFERNITPYTLLQACQQSLPPTSIHPVYRGSATVSSATKQNQVFPGGSLQHRATKETTDHTKHVSSKGEIRTSDTTPDVSVPMPLPMDMSPLPEQIVLSESHSQDSSVRERKIPIAAAFDVSTSSEQKRSETSQTQRTEEGGSMNIEEEKLEMAYVTHLFERQMSPHASVKSTDDPSNQIVNENTEGGESGASSSQENAMQSLEIPVVDIPSSEENSPRAEKAPGDNDIEFLKNCFPSIDADVLKILVDAHGGNVIRVVDEILEGSERLPPSLARLESEVNEIPFVEISDDEEEEEEEEVENLREVGEAADKKDENITSAEPLLPSGRFHVLGQYGGQDLGDASRSPATKRRKSTEDIFTAAASQPTPPFRSQINFSLEPALAFFLLEVYGPFQGLQDHAELKPEDLNVILDKELARMLHEKWRKTVQEKLIRTNVPGQRSSKSMHTTAATGNFQDIMDSEMALDLHNTENKLANSSGAKLDAAAMLKRKKLHQMFPSVDSQALSELFEANGYNLENTIKVVRASCGVPITPTPASSASGTSSSSMPKQHKINEKGSKDSSKDECRSPDSSYQATKNPDYIDYRAEAQMHAKMRSECFRKAAIAHAQKQGDLARYYSQQGHNHTAEMHEANKRAADKIFRDKNLRHEDKTVDLHGLHVNEALLVLKNFLQAHHSRTPKSGSKTLSIITGRGKGSKDGKAKIKPAVLSFLERNNYRFQASVGEVTIYL